MFNNEISINKRISHIRKFNKLNQIEFSKLLNVKQSNISQIESGKIAPSLEILLKIISNFNISCEWLLIGKGEMIKSNVLHEPQEEYGDHAEIKIIEYENKLLKKEIDNLRRKLVLCEMQKEKKAEKSALYLKFRKFLNFKFLHKS